MICSKFSHKIRQEIRRNLKFKVSQTCVIVILGWHSLPHSVKNYFTRWALCLWNSERLRFPLSPHIYYACSNFILLIFTQTLSINRVEKCMHNKCMGLYGNLTSSSVKRKQAFSNPMSPLNVLSCILPGEKIGDFHFKAVFSGILNTTYGRSIIVFSLPIWYMCCLLKTLHPDSHGMEERGLNGLCLSHRAGEGFVGCQK